MPDAPKTYDDLVNMVQTAVQSGWGRDIRLPGVWEYNAALEALSSPSFLHPTIRGGLYRGGDPSVAITNPLFYHIAALQDFDTVNRLRQNILFPEESSWNNSFIPGSFQDFPPASRMVALNHLGAISGSPNSSVLTGGGFFPQDLEYMRQNLPELYQRYSPIQEAARRLLRFVETQGEPPPEINLSDFFSTSNPTPPQNPPAQIPQTTTAQRLLPAEPMMFGAGDIPNMPGVPELIQALGGMASGGSRQDPVAAEALQRLLPNVLGILARSQALSNANTSPTPYNAAGPSSSGVTPSGLVPYNPNNSSISPSSNGVLEGLRRVFEGVRSEGESLFDGIAEKSSGGSRETRGGQFIPNRAVPSSSWRFNPDPNAIPNLLTMAYPALRSMLQGDLKGAGVNAGMGAATTAALTALMNSRYANLAEKIPGVLGRLGGFAPVKDLMQDSFKAVTGQDIDSGAAMTAGLAGLGATMANPATAFYTTPAALGVGAGKALGDRMVPSIGRLGEAYGEGGLPMFGEKLHDELKLPSPQSIGGIPGYYH